MLVTRTVRERLILNRFFVRWACGLALEQAVTLISKLYIQVYVWPVEKNICPDNSKKYQKPIRITYHVPTTRAVRKEWILNQFFFGIACGLALEQAVTLMSNLYIQVYMWPVQKNICSKNSKQIPKARFVSPAGHWICPQRVNTQWMLCQMSMWPSPGVGGDSDLKTL